MKKITTVWKCDIEPIQQVIEEAIAAHNQERELHHSLSNMFTVTVNRKKKEIQLTITLAETS